jgi:hypothetical protein
MRAMQLTAVVMTMLAAQPARAGDEGDSPAVNRVAVLGHYDNAVGTSDAASQGSVTAGADRQPSDVAHRRRCSNSCPA